MTGKITNTAGRLKEIMDEYGYSQQDILRKCQPFCKQYGIKLGHVNMSNYVNGINEPNSSKLTILGMALNVSEVWLMGYDVPKERKQSIELTDDEIELVKMYRQMSGIGKDYINHIMDMELKNNRKE